MSITDELRKWFDRYTMRKDVYDELTAIADRIDAEHEEALSKAYMDVSDSEWVRLPKDADGEPIHMGDLVTVPWKDKVYEVAGFSCTKQLCSDIRTIWIDVYSPGKQRNVPLCGADSCRHYHAPTVEDVLYDSLKHFGAVGERTQEVDSWVCEQAAKLREMLAGDAE